MQKIALVLVIYANLRLFLHAKVIEIIRKLFKNLSGVSDMRAISNGYLEISTNYKGTNMANLHGQEVDIPGTLHLMV